jgi:hypothetical protein
MFPADQASVHDENGVTPLLLALQAPLSPQFEPLISVLLEWNPRAVRCRDSDGRFLPVARALKSRKPFAIISALLDLYPESLQEVDVDGFHMFELAAVHSPDLDTVYTILRGWPEPFLRLRDPACSEPAQRK